VTPFLRPCKLKSGVEKISSDPFSATNVGPSSEDIDTINFSGLGPDIAHDLAPNGLVAFNPIYQAEHDEDSATLSWEGENWENAPLPNGDNDGWGISGAQLFQVAPSITADGVTMDPDPNKKPGQNQTVSNNGNVTHRLGNAAAVALTYKEGKTRGPNAAMSKGATIKITGNAPGVGGVTVVTYQYNGPRPPTGVNWVFWVEVKDAASGSTLKTDARILVTG
jgi:hypothetical protein